MSRRRNLPREERQWGRLPRLLLGYCAPVVAAALVVWFFCDTTQGPRDAAPVAGSLLQATPSASPVARGALGIAPRAESATERFLARFGADVEALQNGRGVGGREEEQRALLASVSLGQISSALEFLKQAEQTATVRELRALLIRRWAEHDPKAAAGHASDLPAGEARQEALNQVAISWANSDPAGVRAWSAAMATGAEQQEVVMSIAHEWTRTQPMDAIELAVGLPANARRDDLLGQAVAEWTTFDPHEAIAWARHLPDEAIRDRMMAAALTAWANQDPLSAARLAMFDLPSTRVQADALASIAQHWAQHDPLQVNAALGQLPPGELQRGLDKDVLKIWERELGENPRP